MGRGGTRVGAGRKSTWASRRKITSTKLIRVPKEFADQLLDIARRLDSGEAFDLVTESEKDSVTKSKADLLLPEIDATIKKWRTLSDKASLKNNHWSKARLLIKELELLLESETVTNSTNESVTVSRPKLIPLIDSVANSKKVDQLELLIVEDNAELFLSEAKLSERLKSNRSTLRYWRKQKSPEDLAQITRSKDTDGIAWAYSQEKKHYSPYGSLSVQQRDRLLNWKKEHPSR